jgi:hypothetical protein
MKELRIRKPQTRLASLLNLHFFSINLTQGEKHNPRQIALHARLLRDCFPQINRKPERHSWPVVSRLLAFLDRSPGLLLLCHERNSYVLLGFSVLHQRDESDLLSAPNHWCADCSTHGNLIYHDTPQLPCTSQYSDSFLRLYPMANLPAVGRYGTLKAMYIAVKNE